MGLHAGGTLHVAPGDKACLRVRPLQPAWLLGTLRRLQYDLLLQCHLSAVSLFEPLAHMAQYSSEMLT